MCGIRQNVISRSVVWSLYTYKALTHVLHPTPPPPLTINQPARGATDETLQDEELQDWAKERAKAMLAKGRKRLIFLILILTPTLILIFSSGVPLTAAKAPHSTLARCKAKLILSDVPPESSPPSPSSDKPRKRSRGGSRSASTKASPNTVAREAVRWAIVYPNGDQKSWDEARCVSSAFRLVALTTPTESPVLPPPLAMMQAAITNHHTDVVAKDAPMLLRKLCTRFKMREILRGISLLSHCRQQFRFPLVNRGGGGLAEQVVACDHGAFEFLMSLSALYPAALQPSPTRPFDFVVPHLPLMWHVRAQLKAIVAGDKGHPSPSAVASSSAPLSPRAGLHAADTQRLVTLAKDLVSRMREAVSACQPSDRRSVKDASGALMRVVARTDRSRFMLFARSVRTMNPLVSLSVNFRHPLVDNPSSTHRLTSFLYSKQSIPANNMQADPQHRARIHAESGAHALQNWQKPRKGAQVGVVVWANKDGVHDRYQALQSAVETIER